MPAQTGLSQLGDALLRGTGDYANIQLRKRQEDERRVQQLADLQNNRQYAGEQFDKQRGLQLADRVTGREENFTDASRLAVMNNRFDTLQRAEKMGLITASDFGNITVENVALKKLQEFEVAESKRFAELRDRAQKRVDANAKEEDKIIRKIAADDRIANSEQEVDPSALRKLQERMARSANPKKKEVSEADIDAQYESAMAEYEKDATMEWMKRTAAAKTRAQNNTLMLRGIREENQQLGNKYGVVGDVPVAAEAEDRQVNPVVAPIDPMAAFKAAREKELRDNPPPPPAPAPSAVLANPMNNPVLADYQAQQALAQQASGRQNRTNELANLLEVRDEARSRGGNLAAQLQAPAPPSATPFGRMAEMNLPEAFQTPAQVAANLSAVGADEASATAAYRKLLMSLAPPAQPKALPRLPSKPYKTLVPAFGDANVFR